MGNNLKKLFEEFPPVSVEQWEEAIRVDLKGADYEKKLVWKTDEGFKVKPYYTSEDIKNLAHLNYEPGKFPYVRGTKSDHNQWEIIQDIVVDDEKITNSEALDALNRGATGICFKVDKSSTKDLDLSSLLKDIYIQCIELQLETYIEPLQLWNKLENEFDKRVADSKNAKGSLGYNPLGMLTQHGSWIINEETDFSNAKELITKVSQRLPGYRVLLADGRLIREAGSSTVQEMAYTLAIGNEYLHRLSEAGTKIETIAPRIQFNLSIGSNYFFEIAKIRAFRMLWSKIVEAYGVENQEAAKAFIHATTARYNMTLYDPYVNMLRQTTESMSAVIGGIDSLSVRPFNSIYQQPNSFSNRIARNVQIILKEEAYFDKVADPAGGSYYIEALTASLAQEAWKEFLWVEEQGGYSKAFQSGTIQQKVKSYAQKMFSDVAARKATILGTNQYPNFNETVLSQINKDVYWKQDCSNGQSIAEPLQPIRISTEIENMRLKTEMSNKRPKVFMLTIGNLAMRLARSQFSCNFFAVAGFEVIDNNGFATISEGIEAGLKAKADIIVLCSSDEEYATLAPEAFKLLENRAIFVVAGNPPCMEELKSQGITNFISIRSNLLETLTYYQKLLGIN
ncbi:MAG: methylmalonyl-CoA mutase family protein [Bacteroidales bacterium]|nr:methylmalonyl-CoA mutase family protein [Bacteroidales bacterium]